MSLQLFEMLETVENPTGGQNITSFQRDSDKITIKNLRKYWKPAQASLVVAIGSILIGANLSYPPTTISYINSHLSSFRVNSEEQSWIASLFFLAGGVGSRFGGFLTDKVSRKLIMKLGTLPLVFGWSFVAGADFIDTMYAGSIINGFCFGLFLSNAQVYISEISPPEIRGHLMSFHQLALNVAFLLTYVVGTYVQSKYFCWLFVIFSILLMGLLNSIPESPRWLLMHGKQDEAVVSLNWLRGLDISKHEAEIATIHESLKQSSVPVPWLDYLRPHFLKYLLVTQFLFILQELSGVNIIRLYTVSIFQASGSSLDANMQTIVVGVVFIVGSCIFTSAVDNFERRTFLLISSVTVGVGMAALGTWFKVKSLNENFAQEYLFWLPLLSMAVATFGFTLGIGPLPYVLTSELFSTRARGRASSWGVITLCLFGCLTTKFFINVSDAIGEFGAFWICAGVCILGAVVAYFLEPKTKGKMLENI